MQEYIWHIKTYEKFFIIFLEVIKVFFNYTLLYSKCKTKKKSVVISRMAEYTILNKSISLEQEGELRTFYFESYLIECSILDRVQAFVVMPQNLIFFEEMNALMEE